LEAVVENMWIIFILFWIFNMHLMMKSWVSFFLLNMLNWRILKKLWLECDSFLFYQAFYSVHIISWTFKGR